MKSTKFNSDLQFFKESFKISLKGQNDDKILINFLKFSGS